MLLDAESFRGIQRLGTGGLVVVAPENREREAVSGNAAESCSIACRLACQPERDCVPIRIPEQTRRTASRRAGQGGTRHFGPHGLRHLFTSLLISGGAEVKFTQDRLGRLGANNARPLTRSLIGGREYTEKVEESFPFVSKMLAEGPSHPAFHNPAEEVAAPEK